MRYRIVYYNPRLMQDIVDFAIATLKAHAPVGSEHDQHPGLYRDSNLIFLNGHIVPNVLGWKPGDEIDISNPVPYARKIETGRMKTSVPGHDYEDATNIVKMQYGSAADISFKYMPVRFGDQTSFSSFSGKLGSGGHKVSVKEKKDWLISQPAMQIRSK